MAVINMAVLVAVNIAIIAIIALGLAAQCSVKPLYRESCQQEQLAG